MTHHEAPGRGNHGYPEDDRYCEWDAAYVLGALSPAERREFEDHLKLCERCSVAVVELAAMPGLLGSLPADDALGMLETKASELVTPDQTPASILPRLTARVRKRRRIRTGTVAGVAAAAAIFVSASVVSDALNPPAQPSVSLSLQQAVPSPLTANIELTSVEWGTRVEMICDYRAATSPDGGSSLGSRTRYGLYVTDNVGTATRVSTWTSSPGETVTVPGSIDTPLSDITALEVRSLDTGKTLLARNIR